MRLTTIFLTAVLLSAYTPGASQQITYSGKQVKLVTVFKEVKKQTGYFIAYDLLLIEKAAPVTIRAINQPLNSFMKELLKGQPLSFRIEANTIVITPAPLKPPVIALPELEVLSPQSISGKVVDSLGKPIQGASVKIAGTSTGTITKSDGSFRINNVEQGRYTLEISSVGYETMIKMVSVSHQDVEIGTLTLQQSSQQMEDVVVVNTGYQKLKPNEMVGAVEVITSEQLNINTGTTILDRLKNLSTALSFDRISNGRVGSGNKLGITIRGLSTLNGPADPLIVLDNFIYDGDIENIDPNTIESVTILKDAVATSIWGPRAGNGVIVLTSKRAKRSSKPMISVRTATVIMPPPNLKKYPSADTRSFIDLELQHGITPNLTRYYDGYDPLKKIIIDRSKNLISAEDSARLVDELAQVDFRDEYQRAFYQTGIQQTYNISVSHGTEFVSTGFSAGFAKNETNLKAVDKRLNLGFNNAITLTKKLKLYQSLSYNNSQGRTGAPGFRSVNTFYNPSRSLPYIRFFEPDGSPSGYGYQFNTNFLDTFGRGMLLDWKFYPAEDYKHNYATSNVNALNLTTGLQYSLSKHFNLHIDYGLQSPIFGAVMIGIVAVLSCIAGASIENADWLLIITGLTGLYLLLCAYAAVGLFMSSLTTYPIVAAITTFAVLSFISNVQHLWQDIPVVRDITYWFSLAGRSATFISGLISTESVLYFIAFIGFFLGLAIVKLRTGRSVWSKFRVTLQYASVVVVVAATGYISSLPSMKKYADLTRTDLNTLTPASQEVMKQLKDGLTITTYANVFSPREASLVVPIQYKLDVARYDMYTRFKPDIRFNYQYYYKELPGENERLYPDIHGGRLLDTIRKIFRWKFDVLPFEKLHAPVNFEREGYGLITGLSTDSGRNAVLRFYDGYPYPQEMQITAALKRLVTRMPVIGFLQSHGERNMFGEDERGYENLTIRKRSSSSLLNLGFDFEGIDLLQPVPPHIDIIWMADVRTAYSATELQHLQQYIYRGGNLFIAGEPGRQSTMNPVLELIGVQLADGMLYQSRHSNIQENISCQLTPAAESFNYYFKGLWNKPEYQLPLNTATTLHYKENNDFRITELFRTDSTAWLEKEGLPLPGDTALFNADAGEVKQQYATVLALTRMVNRKKQTIIVSGDADWLSNSQLPKEYRDFFALNTSLFFSSFSSLSDEKAPIDIRRPKPTDNQLKLERATWKILAPVLKWSLSTAFLIAGILILIRRKGR